MNVAGIDVSTKTGFVVLDDKGKVREARELVLDELPKGSGPQRRLMRVLALKKIIDAMLNAQKVELAAIEGYSMASRFNNYMQTELAVAARFALWHTGTPFYEVPPSSLKKFATGVGSGDKSKVRLGVFKRWQFEHESDNVVDAYVLARVCLAAGCGAKKTETDSEIVMMLKRAVPVGPV